MKPFYVEEAFRFSSKANNANERSNFEQWYTEQINLFGQEVEYHTYKYSLTGHDMVYGEQPAVSYKNAVKIVMLLELNESSIIFSKFGIQSEDDITAFVPISSYYTLLSSSDTPRPEPKAGDVFTLSEYGDDRVGGRGGKSFEVTQRLDQDISKINPLAGHYVWMLQAKRLDYTFEPGLTAEKASDQVYDNSFAGRLSGGTNPQTDIKVTTDDVNVEAKSNFDYTDIKDADDVYGDYY